MTPETDILIRFGQIYGTRMGGKTGIACRTAFLANAL